MFIFFKFSGMMLFVRLIIFCQMAMSHIFCNGRKMDEGLQFG